MNHRPIEPRELQGLSQGAPARPKAAPGPNPAFQALLERLSASAQELQQRAQGVEKPEQLAGAVDQARQSLDDALALGNRLIEAWRAEGRAPNTQEPKA